MSEAVGLSENVDWTKELGCPPSVHTDNVKKILYHGIMSVLWEEISSSIFCVDEVVETRKNILLHCLKNKIQLPLMKNIYNTKGLKAERSILNQQIITIENECKKIDESIHQKELKLLKIKNTQQHLKPKKNILELKYEEIKEELNHCKQMSIVCNNFLPSKNYNLNEGIIQNCLLNVGGITSKAEKRQAWMQISDSLDDIAVPKLWDWLLNKRIEDTNKLVNLKLQYNIDNDISTEKTHESLSVGISKASGQRILSTIDKLIHSNRTKQLQEYVETYLAKITETDGREFIQDWLLVALEVPQLERKQKILQSELDDIEIIIRQEDNLMSNYNQLSSDIYDIDLRTEKCLQAIDKSLENLKHAGEFLIKVKDQLLSTLETIIALNDQNNDDWLSCNLSSEIEIFYDKLDINAVNKIMLTGKIGAYRHSSTCISNAILYTPPVTFISPVFKSPLYHLIYIFRNLIIHQLLKYEKENEQNRTSQYELDLVPNLNSSFESREEEIINLLDLANDKSEKCHEEIEKFNSIYDIWVHQPFNELMIINKNTVYQATYSEWIQRFTRLTFMIQRTK